MKTTLEVIGAVVVATLILGIPVLSFVSFPHDWNVSLQLFFLTVLIVDFLYVSSKLIEDSEGEKKNERLE